MTADDVQKIDQQVTELLNTVFGSVETIKLPLDLNKVLSYYGLTLREGTFEGDELAGALDRESKTIFVESSDDFARKNFTIAHELGHFRLHQDLQTDIFYRYQVRKLWGLEEDKRELEANRFAGDLLMPEKFIRDLWAVTQDTEKLAQIFGVSPEAMRYRLQHLQLMR